MSSGSSVNWPRPTSPTKDSLKPNAHPYPIKTTSTGVLSRSNSSPQHISHHTSNTYHYVPTSLPSPKKPSNPAAHHHRYSRSLTSELPRPLPVPPSFSRSPSASPTRQYQRTHKRADTLPSALTTPLDELPPNPKVWTPSQLSLYLSTALCTKSGEALELPAPVVHDIAAFIRQSKITGRTFLKFSENDLEKYEINHLWRTALLSASSNLRQNDPQGQIRGSSADRSIIAEDAGNLSSSSSTLDDGLDEKPAGRPRRRTENGRVRGMVESLERSSSADDGWLSSGSGHRGRERSGSVSSVDSISEDDEVRQNATGRERGREGWSGRSLPFPPPFAGGPSQPQLEPQSTGNGRPLPLPPSPYQYQPPSYAGRSSGGADAELTNQELLEFLSSPTKIALELPTSGKAGALQEEPTIEELLASSPPLPVGEGAAAWEADVWATVKQGSRGRATAKRAPANAPAETDSETAGTGTDAFETASEAASTATEGQNEPEPESEDAGKGTAGEPTIEELLAASSVSPAEAREVDLAETAGQVGSVKGSVNMNGKKGKGALLLGGVGRGGVFAWEEGGDDEGRVTVKRISPVPIGEDNEAVDANIEVAAGSGRMRMKTGSRRGKEVRRRGVGDLFAGIGEVEAGADTAVGAVAKEQGIAGEVSERESGEGESDAGMVERAVGDANEGAGAAKQREKELDLALEAQEQQLREDVHDMRRLLEVFRGRLDEVEMRIGEMEERERERDKERQLRESEREETQQRQWAAEEEEDEDGDLSIWGRIDPKLVLRSVLMRVWPGAGAPAPHALPSTPASSVAPADDRARRLRRRRASPDPTSIATIPSYVILVGIGVCAVVLRVVLKRALRSGRR